MQAYMDTSGIRIIKRFHKEIIMDILYFVILSVVAIAAVFFQGWLNQKERKSLLNRVMAKDYEQLNYYEKMFQGEVKELKDQRSVVRKEMGEDEEIKKEVDAEFEKERKFIGETDEHWNEEDVDLPELRERLGKE